MTLRTQTRRPAAGVFGKTSRRASVRVLLAVLLVPALLLGGCARPLADVNDACAILEKRKNWYYALIQARKNWDVPVALILSFIRQESGFRSRAKPERTKLLGFIPWKRVTSAYGYSQATDGTWKQYQEETGEKLASRNSFSDASDFIGWYNNKSVRVLGLAPQDAYSLYLAYHEGWSGYRKKSYRKKPWLIEAAKKVQQHTNTYSRQLGRCAGRLKVPWYRLFSASGADPVSGVAWSTTPEVHAQSPG